MPSLDSSRIVIERVGGRVEVLGRKGFHDPMVVARLLAGEGRVIAVRHERRLAGGKAETVGVHRVGG